MKDDSKANSKTSSKKNSLNEAPKMPIKKKLFKKFNLTTTQVEDNIAKLTSKIDTLEGPENRKKRMNLFAKIKKLKMAQSEPDKFLFDKDQEEKRLADKQKRINKKLEQKKNNPGEKRKAKILE